MAPKPAAGIPPPPEAANSGVISEALQPPPVDQTPLSPESVLLAEAGQYHAMAVSAAEAENFVDA